MFYEAVTPTLETAVEYYKNKDKTETHDFISGLGLPSTITGKLAGCYTEDKNKAKHHV